MKLHVPDAGGDGVSRTQPSREALRGRDASLEAGIHGTFGVSKTLDFFRQARQLQVNEAIVGHASRVQAGNAESN